MFTFKFYEPLFELSGAIEYSNSSLKETKNPFKKDKIRKQIKRLDKALKKSLKEHAELAISAAELTDDIVNVVNTDLLEIETNSDESWHQAINDVKPRFIEAIKVAQKSAKREAAKSPLRRKIEKNSAPIGIAAAVLLAVTLKFVWLVPIDQPGDTAEGISQRAQAFEKVLDYDDSFSTRVRKGGFLKPILLWPIKPTEAEIEAASEFVSFALVSYEELQNNNRVCSGNQIEWGSGLSDFEINVTKVTLKGIQSAAIGDDIVQLAFRALETEFSCA